MLVFTLSSEDILNSFHILWIFWQIDIYGLCSDITFLSSLFLSLSDWPSPAPNPSLTMQLWVLSASPRRICCLSATMSLNNTHTAAQCPAVQELDRNRTTGPETNKKTHSSIHYLNTQWNISRFPVRSLSQRLCLIFCSCCTEARLNALILLTAIPVNACQSTHTPPSVNSHFQPSPAIFRFTQSCQMKDGVHRVQHSKTSKSNTFLQHQEVHDCVHMRLCEGSLIFS